MGGHKLNELLKEYRKQPKWYYHVIFDSIETGQLFNNDDEYSDGMNSVAIGQYVCGLSVIVFVLMANHCHILVHGSGEDIVRFFLFVKERVNRKLKEDGFPQLPVDYGFKMVKVNDERQLVDTIIYIARNPLKARPDVTASGYIWGSTNLIFSDIDKLYDKLKIADMSCRESTRIFKTKIKLPGDYLFNRPLGFILPESYVLNGKVERMLVSSWRFCSGFVRNFDAYLKIAEGVGEMIIFSENELNEIIYHILRNRFKVDSIKDLGLTISVIWL
ncbi:MAG TPA: hypothetical protein DDX40_09130 [Rikenellaceae bacterium]|nr:hypothetical protein [Rikenellaceae bacterium]